jgi:two-component system response regulator AgrA
LLKIIICEDDYEQRDNLVNVIQNIIDKHDVSVKIDLATSEAIQLQEYVDNSMKNDRKGVVRAYFLDIDLKQEINGLDLAHYIREKDYNAYIVFITFLQKHIKNVFKYKTFDFITKTYQDQLLKDVEDVVIRLIEDFKRFYGQNEKTVLKFSHNNMVRAIPIGDFIGIKKDGDVYKAFTTHGVFRYFNTLQNILDSVEDDNILIRPHQSVIVNKNHITAINKRSRKIITTNNIEFEISRRKYKEVLDQWYTD